tara:strand:+ start:83 stop:622 length:540 start_codon:yes stop_codon:yes gene_type:complete
VKLTKRQLEGIVREAASDYVYGVKNPARVANKYKLSTLKKILLEEIEDLDERCQKGYKTHATRKTKKMFGRTYRNCVKAEGMEEDSLDEIFGLANSISSNILHLGKEDRALIERDLDKIRDLAQMEVMDERKLKPTEKRKLKRLEKEVPKKDFTDRYGEEGKSIYYATLTKMAKKDKKK